ncbi:hypothetical protein AWB69_09084 [Caballeronia udeis]|uniref:Uncharacterized protein n=1 Tax=Caballeronia udeis TaxID=1232866 RepID=A0A158JYF3_9BURK|nr:hypothetical protein [Caballeronia udeis]SAL73828.1 hypothetical protein AWB69_09084 [Caballeronia udeis]
MNLISVQQALEATSPGRFQVQSWQDRHHLFITVRLLGANNLFVPSFCRKQVVGNAGPGAASAAAFGQLLAYIEDQTVRATMCDMGLAEVVTTSGRTAGHPFA